MPTSGTPGRRRKPALSIPEAMDGIRADWGAARDSRLRRRRTGMVLQGSGADFHVRNEYDYLKIVEYARDFARNDPACGPFTARVVDNTVQGGFTPDPQTGERALNRELRDRWNEWTGDPRACDVTGKRTFGQQQRQAFRQRIEEGDNFALSLASGQVQWVEGHRARTPIGMQDTTVLGVELNPQRRPVRYWFTPDEIDPNQIAIPLTDLESYDAFDEMGFQQVFHVSTPTRFSQTRGMSAFAPLFDMFSMFEDINFANLVKQQVVSCITFFREREKDFVGGFAEPHGEESTEREGDSVKTLQGWAPGTELTGKPGERLSAYSPQVSTPAVQEQLRLVLTLIGVNLGCPLILALLEPGGSFSAYRGAMDQAKLGFQANQREFSEQLHAPLYARKIDEWADQDPRLYNYRNSLGSKYYRHRWDMPAWPYIDPVSDVQSDMLQFQNVLNSPRRIQGKWGRQWTDIASEYVSDVSYAIRRAMREAKRINDEYKPVPPVSWRDLLPLPMGTGATLSVSTQTQPPEGEQPGGTPSKPSEEDFK